jgi:betaine lipid synthase
MDSMDWFFPPSSSSTTTPTESPAHSQIRSLNCALVPGGRVLLRSAALRPWYLKLFEETGFRAQMVAERRKGGYVDRVNMYKSCWVCVKVRGLPPGTPQSLLEDIKGNGEEEMAVAAAESEVLHG